MSTRRSRCETGRRQNNTLSRQRLVDIRLQVYASYAVRADALFDRVDALDTTIAPRPDAATVPDRAKVYSGAQDKAIPAHQVAWLGRVIAFGKSWFAPREVVRGPASRTPGEVGAEQVQRLAADPTPITPKVVAVDRHFPVPPFLCAFAGRAPPVVLLARLATNRALYGPPPPSNQPGRPPPAARLHRRERAGSPKGAGALRRPGQARLGGGAAGRAGADSAARLAPWRRVPVRSRGESGAHHERLGHRLDS